MKVGGNTIVITGGGSGIGLALAAKFLELDNTVIAIGRDGRRLQGAQNVHPRLRIFECDVTDHHDVDALLNFLDRHHPDVNMLINNAGVQYNYAFADEDPRLENARSEIDVNLFAPVRLCKAFLPRLMECKEAAIVNVTSGLAAVPKQSAPLYSATKAALHMFTKTLRWQLEGSPVSVYELLPPLVDTAMTAGRGKKKLSPEAVAEQFVDAMRNGQLEVRVGKTRWLFLVNRIWPGLAERIVRKL